MVESRVGVGSAEEMAKEARAFFTPRVEPPHIEMVVVPEELPEVQRTLRKRGFKMGHIFYPAVTLNPDMDVMGWSTRPNQYFWAKLRGGQLPQDAESLFGVHALIETIQRPNYEAGRQMYPADPLADTLAEFRATGVIKIPDWCEHIPPRSRFGVSAAEIYGHIVPYVTNLTEGAVDFSQVGVPRAIEFNYAGNLRYPEFGRANTWEWFADDLGAGYRLVGGSSDRGGLASVGGDRSDAHDDRLGFRLQVVFPSK